MDWVKFHLTLTVLWTILIVPSLVLWRNSVPWLIFMSAWALVGSHWSAAQAAMADKTSHDDAARILSSIKELSDQLDK